MEDLTGEVCLHCGYDLRGASSSVCPECGIEGATYGPALRKRRKRLFACVAVANALAWLIAVLIDALRLVDLAWSDTWSDWIGLAVGMLVPLGLVYAAFVPVRWERVSRNGFRVLVGATMVGLAIAVVILANFIDR